MFATQMWPLQVDGIKIRAKMVSKPPSGTFFKKDMKNSQFSIIFQVEMSKT